MDEGGPVSALCAQRSAVVTLHSGTFTNCWVVSAVWPIQKHLLELSCWASGFLSSVLPCSVLVSFRGSLSQVVAQMVPSSLTLTPYQLRSPHGQECFSFPVAPEEA